MRWLLLDVGGVLVRVDDETWPAELASRWAARLGLAPQDFDARVDAADLPDATLRDDVEEVYWQRYGAAVGADPDTLAEMRADFWDAYCGTAEEELLRFLHQQVGRVGLAILSSSGDGARREEERRFGWSRLFDPICYSHEMGVRKPDPRAFRFALERMGARPADVLFVDNTPDNVRAARELGLHALLHESVDVTLAALRRFVGTEPRTSPPPDR